MKFIRTFAGRILVTELAITVALIVGLMVPLPGRVEFKIVQSGSMEPQLPVGSVVVVVPAPTYAVGDIITFGDDTKKRIPTTHRVYGIEREGGSVRYLTKGDANEEADGGSIPYREVIGKVVLTVPRLGYVLEFARSRNGFLTTVVVPASLVILDELLTIFGVVRMRVRARTKMGRAYGYANVPDEAGAFVPAHDTYHIPRSRMSIDGVRTVARTRLSVRERLHASVEGYTVTLRAA